MRLRIIHTTDERLEGATFEVDDPIITNGTVSLCCGYELRIDKTQIVPNGYQYSNPNYIAVAREEG